MTWRPRILVLPLSALLILGLVVFREGRKPQQGAAQRRFQQLAPAVELNDQNNKSVRLRGYLGRTRLVVVFFDGPLGADRDVLVRPLMDRYEKLKAAGIQVFGISMATPYANRQAERRLGHSSPFPLLTDISIDPRNPVPAPAHRLWGRFDSARDEPLTGLFLVDRRGYVTAGEDGFPEPEEDPQRVVASLIRGEWPLP